MQLSGKKQALVGASVIVWFYGSIVFGLFGVLSAMWQEMFTNVNPAITGLLLMLAMFTMGALNYSSAKFAAKKGTRVTSALSATFAALAVLGFALAKNVGMAILFPSAIMLGICGSLGFGPGMTCIQKWWPPQKGGMVSGIFNFCFGFSAVIMLPIYRALLGKLGYQPTLFIVSGMIFVAGIISSFFTASPKARPAAAGGAPAGGMPQLPGFTLKESTASPSFKLLWLIWGFGCCAGMGIVPHITKLAETQGFTLAQGTMLLVFFNLFNSFIKIVVGPLSDKVNPKHLLWPIFLIAGICSCLLTKVTGFAIILVMLAFIGMTVGDVFTVMPVMVRKFFGMRAYGAVFGLVFTSFCFFSSFFGPFVGGLLSRKSYTPATVMFGIFLIIAALLTLIVRAPKKPNKAE